MFHPYNAEILWYNPWTPILTVWGSILDRRQILSSKVDPRAVIRVEEFLFYESTFCISQAAFIMAWITDEGRTFFGGGARVACSARSTGIFRVLESVSAMKTISQRPTVERVRGATIFTKLWDAKISSLEGMFVMKELVRIEYL